MTPGRVGAAVAGLAVGAFAAASAMAMSLSDAIALAQSSNPGLAEHRAQADAARARLEQANAGRLPTVTLSGEAGTGSADLGGFFGFARSTVHPDQAAIEMRQPLFAGGAINAAIDQARAAREAALQDVGDARARLSTEVAQAYVAVLDARQQARLVEAERVQVQAIVDQARLRFNAGEVARTDLSEAEARLAEIQAAQAETQGAVARAEAEFESVVGAPADALDEPTPAPAGPASLNEAIAIAERSSPAVLGAEAQLQAADAGLRGAEAERLPTIALAASAATMRDEFFPGYRNDGYTVGVEGRWTLFSGGLISGQIDEAEATRRAAEARRDSARAVVRDAVVSAWEDVAVSAGLVKAADAQAAAATSAVDSAAQEVRVGQRPLLDLITAERESLSALTAQVAAHGEAVIAGYRLDSLLGTMP